MPRPVPERTCLVTGEQKLKDDLIRLVIGPDATLVHDITGKLPGRGLYVSLSKSLLTEAIERKIIKRAAKRPITIPDAFETLVEAHLRKRLLEAVSLARKAGAAVSGFDQCHKALLSGKVAVMLHAEDAADDGIRKLTSKENPVLSLNLFDRTALSSVMGGENTVHVAIMEGKGSAFFLKQLRRFTLFLEKTPL